MISNKKKTNFRRVHQKNTIKRNGVNSKRQSRLKNATQIPWNLGNQPAFRTHKTGLECIQKPRFDAFNFDCGQWGTAQKHQHKHKKRASNLGFTNIVKILNRVCSWELADENAAARQVAPSVAVLYILLVLVPFLVHYTSLVAAWFCIRHELYGRGADIAKGVVVNFYLGKLMFPSYIRRSLTRCLRHGLGTPRKSFWNATLLLVSFSPFLRKEMWFPNCRSLALLSLTTHFYIVIL